MKKKQETTETWRNFQVKFFGDESKRLDAYFSKNAGVKKSAILRAAILAYLDKSEGVA